MSDDRTALRAIAAAIAFPIVGDRARTSALADDALAWLDDQPGAADAPVPWLASHVVAVAIVDPPVARRSHDARRSHLAALLRAQPVAARVAFALAVLCGYDEATTAALCRRSPADLATLLAPLQAAAAEVGELADPAEAPEDPPTGGPKRRWFRPRGGTVATVIILLLAIVGVTYPGGARPSFADPPAPSHCDPGSGPGAVTTVRVGPTKRPVRLFIPTGEAQGRSVMLLIGDSGVPPEETVATTGLESAAATEGFVLVTLDGTAGPWNAAGAPSGTDDVSYARAAIDRAVTAGCAEASNLSVVGLGTGAHLAAAVACDPSVAVRRLVMVHGTYLPPACAPRAPVSVLMDVDKTDDVLPISGGWGTTATPSAGYSPTSLDATYDGWSRIDGCSATTTGEVDSDHVVVSSRPECATGVQVVTRESDGGGHPWPAEAVGAIVRFVSPDSPGH